MLTNRRHAWAVTYCLAVLLGSAVPLRAQGFSETNLTTGAGVALAFAAVEEAMIAYTKGKEWPAGLPSIDQLLTHKSERVRRMMCATLATHARKPEVDHEKRLMFVELLTGRLSDPSGLVTQYVWPHLLPFSAGNFSDVAKRNVREKFLAFKSKSTILTMGIVDADFCIEQMRGADVLLDPEKPLVFSAWWVVLVKARNGDNASVDLVLEVAAQHEKDTSPRGGIKLMQLFDHLEYVHHPKVVEYFRRHLFSDKVIKSGSHDVGDMNLNTIAASSLHAMLRGFPSEGKDSEWPASIPKCRKWMAEQTEWEFKDF